jgi:hypothetical protein
MVDWLLAEAISRHDFFDFYTLLHAYYNEMYDPGSRAEIERRLREVTDYIFSDHLRQLGTIIIGRLASKAMRGKTFKAFFASRGLTAGPPDFGTRIHKVTGLERLSIQELVETVSTIMQMIGKREINAMTGPTWRRLIVDFMQLAQAHALKDKILAIDRIHGLTHHRGTIAMHMDERNWLGAALDLRSIASPDQLRHYASADVAGLVGTFGSIGQRPTPLQRLRVAADRHFKAEMGASYRSLDYKLIMGADELNAYFHGRCWYPPDSHDHAHGYPTILNKSAQVADYSVGRGTIRDMTVKITVRDVNGALMAWRGGRMVSRLGDTAAATHTEYFAACAADLLSLGAEAIKDRRGVVRSRDITPKNPKSSHMV